VVEQGENHDPEHPESGAEPAGPSAMTAADAAADAGDTADAAADTAAPPAPRRPGRAVRIIAGTVSVIGELLITAGIVLGLFVAYSLWWTNVLANKEASRDSSAVRDLWDQEEPAEDDGPPAYDPQEGIGFLHVPAMSKSEILVKEGVDLDTLNGAVAGYYDDPVESAMPWDEEGNFSLAAHRDGHGAKFHNIHKLDEGDTIVFETRDTWFVYRVYATLPETSRFNTAVLDPVPEESGATEAGQYITLTTCTPVYSSSHRYIVWGELERTEEVDELRTPPAELRD
jgi:LPXTG-site transpeptidase (sortase) family protein